MDIENRGVRLTVSCCMSPFMLSLAFFTATLVSLLTTDTNSAKSLFVADKADTDFCGGSKRVP